MVETWAVIPTRDREELLHRCLDSLAGQVDGVVVVNNSDTPLDLGGNVDVINRPEWPPNLSAMWNRGLDHVAEHIQSAEWNVAVVNDDAELPAGWVGTLSDALARTGTTLAYVDRYGRPEKVSTEPPQNPGDQITGWAFMLRGADGFRFDETLRWWYGDTDCHMAACRTRGYVSLAGPQPVHHLPNGHTNAHPVLAEQAGKDRQRFAEIWGSAPW